ncbi:MAG: hypothetical protein L0Z50_28930 [Verrucomicrobiales bacterium]|nr:hypothetical protein [Verrucomicrobiales bacterium]
MSNSRVLASNCRSQKCPNSRDGEAVTGTRTGETDETLSLAQPGGQTAKLKKQDIATTEAMTISLMPSGLDKALTPEELRDLMTYLLTEAPQKQ